MVLPRPSNTGILISSVMVGLLGLGANLFMQLDPKIFHTPPKTESESDDDSSSTFLEMLFGKADDEESEENSKQLEEDLPGPAKCIADIEEMHNQTELVFGNWEKTGVVPQQLDIKFTSKAEKLCQLVVLDPTATDEQKRRARLTVLAIVFRAARMAPKEHRKAFIRASREVMKGNNPQDNSRVIALKIFLDCNFARPNTKRLLRDLGRFSDHCASTSVAVGVYMSVAKELKRHRQYAIAKDVLKLGLSKHKGKATNRLLNELHKRTIPTSHRIR